MPSETVRRVADETVAMVGEPEVWSVKAEENRKYLASRYDAAVIARQFLVMLGLDDTLPLHQEKIS